MNSRSFYIIIASLVVASILTFAYYALAIPYGWEKGGAEFNWIAFAAIFTTFSCVFMCNYETRWNYPMGILGTFFYSWFFFQTHETTALAIFNMYLVGSLTYGWFRWKSDNNPRPITTMDRGDYCVHGILGVCVFALFMLILIGVSHFRDGMTVNDAFDAISWVDVTLAALSGIAQFAMDNKKLENWMIWIIVDIISIPYFYGIGYYGAAYQYVFLLANACWGQYLWYKSFMLNVAAERQSAVK
jgi:nicotinamide mononucleotide transporter